MIKYNKQQIVLCVSVLLDLSGLLLVVWRLEESKQVSKLQKVVFRNNVISSDKAANIVCYVMLVSVKKRYIRLTLYVSM